MDYRQFIEMPNSEIPDRIAEGLLQSGGITPTTFEEKINILTEADLQQEFGYIRLDSGNYLVSMICPMPGISREMVDWWFWWHPQADVRYQLWYPGEHFKIGYAKRDRAYFTAEKQPPFLLNTQFPVEKIGAAKMPLSIKFVSPDDFGFPESIMQENNIDTIVCGHVGAARGLIQHTEMAHIFKKTKDGLFLISRFWIGQRLKNPLLRKRMLTDNVAQGMAKHCCVEYRNLARKLPLLFQKINASPQNTNEML